MGDKPKKRLNTGNSALFASLVKQVGGAPIDNKATTTETNMPAQNITPEKQTQAATVEVKDKETGVANNTSIQNAIPTVKTSAEQTEPINVEAKHKEAQITANTPVQNATPGVQASEEQIENTNGEAKDYTKKENDLLKRFLSKRKSKGHTSPILVDDSIKEKIDTIATIFGVTTTSFACNIFEEHFKENRQTYLELVSKKKPFTL